MRIRATTSSRREWLPTSWNRRNEKTASRLSPRPPPRSGFFVWPGFRTVLTYAAVGWMGFVSGGLRNATTGNEPSFGDLLLATKSDKRWRHHYEHFYEEWLAPYRHQSGLALLEIGAKEGRSLQTWETYFTNSKRIVGLAYGVDSEQVEHHVANWTNNNHQVVEIVRGDQSKVETMQVLKSKGPFDIIVDDGSHVPEHMIFSLFHLWNTSLAAGGLYVIEDLETSYWPAGDFVYKKRLRGTGIGQPPPYNAVEKFKQLIDVLGRSPIGARNLTILPGDDQLCEMKWGKNLVALRKCRHEEIRYPPVFQKKRYDETIMNAWLEQARASNPTDF